MSYGKITQISPDPNGGFMGQLTDIETTKQYSFSRATGLEDVNNKDIVDFVDQGGVATSLVPNLSIRTTGLNKATEEVQKAYQTLVLAMAKDKNDTDLVLKKF